MTARCFPGLCLAATVLAASTAWAQPARLADCDADAASRVLQAATPAQAPAAAAALWLDRRHIRWPGAEAAGARYAL